MKPPLYQMVRRAGCAAVLVCLAGGGPASAQGTNGIPIVHRVHRYNSHAQLLDGAVEKLPAPPPMPDDLDLPEQNGPAVKENLKVSDIAPLPQPGARRPDPRREKERDPLNSLFINPDSATNSTDPEIKKWGWLAEESEAGRQVLKTYHKPDADDPGQTNALTGRLKNNEAKRQELGSLKANALEALAAGQVATANVARIVQDRAAQDAEKLKQEEARKQAALKENERLAVQRDRPAGLPANNVTLGLERTRRETTQTDPALDGDFSQTRKALAEITSRYQMGLTMADLIRAPAAPAAPAAAGLPADTVRGTADWNGLAGRSGDLPWTGQLGGTPATGSLAPAAPAPTQPASAVASGGSPSWMKVPAGRLQPVAAASSMIEGPKAPKMADLEAGSAAVAPAPPSVPVSSVPPPAPYTPGSITPSFAPSFTPGGYGTGAARTPGALTPSFTPTTPYRPLIETTPLR